MNTCHNMKIVIQTTGGDASSLNYKSENPNKKIANITKRYFTKLKSQDQTLVFCLSLFHMALPIN